MADQAVLEERIDHLQKDVSQIQQDVRRLDGRMNEMQKEIGTVRVEVADVRTMVAHLETKLTGAIGSLEAKITAMLSNWFRWIVGIALGAITVASSIAFGVAKLMQAG